MQNVKFDYKVYDNCIEIIPYDGIEDNCMYEIKIKKAKSSNGAKVLRNYKYEVTTAMTPCYCTVNAVQVALADLDIPMKDILFYIREASRSADHINGEPVKPDSSGRPPFAVEKYTEAQATLNALLKAYIKRSNNAGIKGTLGDVSFETTNTLNSIKRMIDMYKEDVKKWRDAILGYEFEGHNHMVSAIRGKKTSRPTPVSEITQDISRNVNMGIYDYHFTY